MPHYLFQQINILQTHIAYYRIIFQVQNQSHNLLMYSGAKKSFCFESHQFRIQYALLLVLEPLALLLKLYFFLCL